MLYGKFANYLYYLMAKEYIYIKSSSSHLRIESRDFEIQSNTANCTT